MPRPLKQVVWPGAGSVLSHLEGGQAGTWQEEEAKQRAAAPLISSQREMWALWLGQKVHVFKNLPWEPRLGHGCSTRAPSAHIWAVPTNDGCSQASLSLSPATLQSG